jgi:hypothetical protein
LPVKNDRKGKNGLNMLLKKIHRFFKLFLATTITAAAGDLKF